MSAENMPYFRQGQRAWARTRASSFTPLIFANVHIVGNGCVLRDEVRLVLILNKNIPKPLKLTLVTGYMR